MGMLAGVIGTIQATEAIKLLLKIGRPLTDRLLDYDARRTVFRDIKTKRNPNCPLCGTHRTITELIEYGQESCDVRPAVVEPLATELSPPRTG